MLDENICLVIGPIGGSGTKTRIDADILLHAIIEPAVMKYDGTIRVVRSDRITVSGDINKQIMRLLLTARLVICDMTTKNANAFYELALRHASGLPCVHLYHKHDSIPFDVSTMRALAYSTEDIEGSKRNLAKFIATALSASYRSDNPILDVVKELDPFLYADMATKMWEGGQLGVVSFLKFVYSQFDFGTREFAKYGIIGDVSPIFRLMHRKGEIIVKLLTVSDKRKFDFGTAKRVAIENSVILLPLYDKISYYSESEADSEEDTLKFDLVAGTAADPERFRTSLRDQLGYPDCDLRWADDGLRDIYYGGSIFFPIDLAPKE